MQFAICNFLPLMMIRVAQTFAAKMQRTHSSQHAPHTEKVETETMSLPMGGGVRRAYGNHWLNSGLPFLGFMVAGSVGISVLLQVS